MNIIEIINQKRKGENLSREQIKYVVHSYIDNEIADYQMSAFLMAVTINGMSDEETISLTDVLLRSGDTMDLSKINKIVVDKHSTGGVGDKTTLILTPIVAALGYTVAKMSGRGLGHTGGTIDKLESIRGFKTEFSFDDFINQINKVGAAIISQSSDLVPADKKIYALRDVTATTSSIPLIAASIMSKKIASGADVIVLDVKCGSGALLENYDDSVKLAELMVKIGKSFNKKVRCVLTNMDEPLGRNIGNGLEVLESIEVLKGNIKNDLSEVSIVLASNIISLASDIKIDEAKLMVEESIKDGRAYQKLLEMITAQGGNIDDIQISNKCHSITSANSGYLNKIDAKKIGEIVKILGGGRIKKDDEIDLGVGIVLSKKVGDFINEGDELVRIYYNKKDLVIKDVIDCFVIESELAQKKELIYDIIS